MSATDQDPAVWHYRLGDQAYGPMTLAQLQAAANAGVLPPHTAVTQAGTGATQPAALVVRYTGAVAPPPAAAPSNDAAIRMLVPVGRSGWAIAAGYLGLVGWLLFPLAPVALICAELGRREIRSNEAKHGMGRVVVGYIGGALGLLLAAILLLSAASA